MVEIIRKGLGWKVECGYCGSVLKFHLEDMKYLTTEDLEYKLAPRYAQITQYINCPVCSKKVFVKNDDSGWMNGTERIYEEKDTEEV